MFIQLICNKSTKCFKFCSTMFGIKKTSETTNCMQCSAKQIEIKRVTFVCDKNASMFTREETLFTANVHIEPFVQNNFKLF